MSMSIVCLDLEGVLIPEIWIAFAEKTGIEALKRTTRDEPDYDTLMQYRLDILNEHNLKLKDIQEEKLLLIFSRQKNHSPNCTSSTPSSRKKTNNHQIEST